MTLFIGLMSGTSMDGIDAALVDVSQNRLVGGITRPYSAALHEELNALIHCQSTKPALLSQLNTKLGVEFAMAALELLQKTNTQAHQVTAIGSHGQTICHDAYATIPYTMQLACPHTIAERTEIAVVADFRTRDMVLGGQGAPFAPLYHRVLFGDLNPSPAVVNIGGIANLTVLSNHMIGYDVGPGNCLMDAWIKHHQARPYDANGAWAAQGKVIDPMLSALLDDAFFHQKSPKSIGKEYFSIDWLRQRFGIDNYLPEDIQATLLMLTATLIAKACKEDAKETSHLLLCGGGAHNHTLMQTLQTLLPHHHVESTASMGVDPDYLEAMMFAWLASETLSHRRIDLSAITGASKPAILGAVYQI